MRKLIILFALIALLALETVSAQSWKAVIQDVLPGFKRVFFVDESTGWVVGVGGSIYKTTDGGVSWKAQNSGIKADLSALYFMDANVGFAAGDSLRFLKTTNGGATWVPVTTAGGITKFYGIYFADAQKGWLLSSSSSAGNVIYTSDGGATWSVVVNNPSGDLEDMSFADAAHGVVAGGGVGKMDIYYTTDGSTWTKAPVPSLGGVTYSRLDIHGLKMFDKNLVYGTGWGTFSAGLQTSIQVKSTNGGATWTYMPQTDANATYDNMYTVTFKDALTGISAGGPLRGSVISKTTDGGVTWVPLNVPCGVQINGSASIGNKVWLAGDNGVILFSPDFGTTWQNLNNNLSSSLYSITFPGSNVGYAAGYKSVFYKTTDGGRTWKSSFVSNGKVTPTIQSICFVNENLGYAAHAYGLVSKTTDGGNSWNAVIPDTLANGMTNSDVYFINENLGFVVGNFGGSSVDNIYKTTDGGKTWSQITGQVSKALKSVSFLDANNGIVVGAGLKSMYTKDGGATWTASTFTNVPDGTTTDLNKVQFVSSDFAVAFGQKLFLKSVDGGATWSGVNFDNVPNSFASALFTSKQNGWYLGYSYAKPSYNPVVLQTTDGGSTWKNIIDTMVVSTESQYNSIAVDKAGYLWIAGSGRIYTNSPLVSVRETGSAMPGNYSLSQNYPNPFNPSTTIAFTVGNAGRVSLKVYDILGREAVTLIDKEMVSGSYNVEFNAGLSSGVYFYTLKAGNFSSTKKMVILK
jgi:photosystem II stability/assembly factor-like uncharacterized protein